MAVEDPEARREFSRDKTHLCEDGQWGDREKRGQEAAYTVTL